MATDKPRFSVTFSEESYERIQQYQKKHKIKTQSGAVAKLVARAIDDLEISGEFGKNFVHSREAIQLAKDYETLDRFGKKQVRDVMDNEIARCEDESRFLTEDPLQKEEPKVINLYVEPSAAGIATPTMGRDYDLYELKPEDPQGAAYAVRLQGDSMEPYFPDGSIVFVNHDVLRDGEVGIFCVDGGTVCKQYHKEGGIVYLFSLNRKRQDADVILFPEGNRSFICQGRVMTRQRFPVPGR